MKIYRCHKATNEVEGLAGKHRDAWESVLSFERLLSAGQTHGHSRIAGLGLQRGDDAASIWKARVICPSLGGKSSGLRYIYERVTIDGEEYAVALTVYVHQGNRTEEQAVRKRVGERFDSYDPMTNACLRKLERSLAD